MKPAYCLFLGSALAFGQSGSGIDVPKVTHGIERHYNSIKSLKVNFTQNFVDRGGRHLPMSGVLYLEKPRKMLWDYTSPAGQFLLSDGNYDYDYDPKNHEVDRSKVKEADDMRGPLALLLGKIDFDRDFGSYTVNSTDGSITATPKSDKLLFTSITFVAAPDFSVKKLSIRGQDGSTTSFSFDGEVTNPPLSANLFRFVTPPGAVVSDAAKP